MKDRVGSRWSHVVLVCRKCDGGKRLAKTLRRQAGGKGRKARFGVIATGCLKVCPKRGVTVVSTRRPGEWLIVGESTALNGIEAALG